MNNGGGSISCKQCESGQTQSLDGFGCVKCVGECNQCDDGFRTDSDLNGSVLSTSDCIKCNKEDSILIGNSCQSCKPYIYSESDNTEIISTKCNSSLNLIGGFLFTSPTVDDEPNNFNVNFGNEVFESILFKEYSKSAYRTCRIPDRRNITSCQFLSNMCVLNMYSQVTSSLATINPCTAYENLYDREDPAVTSLPWIRYSESYGEYKLNYSMNGINSEYLKLKYSGSCNANNLGFVSAEYNLSGRLIRFGRFDIAQLQLCNILSNYARVSNVSPFSTTNLVQTCLINKQDLFDLSDSQSMKFYDLYLAYGNGSNLFPVPVKVLNYRTLNGEPNRGSNENGHAHQRRFFLFETESSQTSQDSNSKSKFIRFAKSITIQFELVKGKSNGEIYPPVITIDYDFAKRDEATKSVEITFNIEYKMEINTSLTLMNISVGVLASLAFIWSCIRIWNWNKRMGRFAVDFITLFKFLMFLIGSLANALFTIITISSLFWLIFYRAQSSAYVFLPIKSQENLFSIFLIIAFSLKLIDIIYLIFLQSSYDIFFIDWERPKQNTKYQLNDNLLSTQKSLEKTEKKVDVFSKSELNDQNKVSCWRSLFVANEWNELQTYRRINTSIQLISVLFLLKVINLEALAYRDCSSDLFRDANDYKAPWSSILRMAIGSCVYLGVGLIQWIIYTCLYSRCIDDKIGQFVDFCSVSNISIFIMTHTRFGYYIHGRSPHGQADTSMQQMTQALIREETDLSSKRGLEPGNDHQTYSISVPAKLTGQYSKVIAPLYQERSVRKTARRDDLTRSNEFEKRMLAYTQLNKFLISFIDNVS